MTDKPIIQADFVKPNLVPSRKVLQLVFEVPAEAGDHAMAVLGGLPQSGTNRWCAIARLADKTAPDDAAAVQETEPAPVNLKAKRSWNELSMPEQAGIFVNDITFAKWLLSTEYTGYDSTIIQDAATWKRDADAVLKSRCNIESKAQLGVDTNGKAFNEYARGQFIRIEREWRDSQRGETEPAEDAPPVKGGHRAKRAGILCNDPTFQIWAQARAWRLWQMNFEASPECAADIIRANCNVGSRAELDHNEAAGQIWDRIEADYRASQSGIDDETMRERRR